MTALADKLKSIIELQGPMSVSDFMGHCLSDPEHGYYMVRDPFGAKGDFVTAPEVSQLFGELLGAWCVAMWAQIGSPSAINLVEIGPGRGTLAADLIRTAALRGAYRDALNVHLVETSPRLRDQQEKKLATFDQDVTWHERLDQVPGGPMILIANELFDALPIHQFQYRQGHWLERIVGLQDGELVFGTGGREDVANQVMTSEAHPPEEAIVERCPVGEALATQIGDRIMADGGAALLIDYGYVKPGFGDTLQALRDHAPADILATPGEADLTAHVNFHALKGAASQSGALVQGPVDQGDFLLDLGLLERAGQLGNGKSSAIQDQLHDAVERLAAPAQMGQLFKVMAVTQPGIPVFGLDRRAGSADAD